MQPFVTQMNAFIESYAKMFVIDTQFYCAPLYREIFNDDNTIIRIVHYAPFSNYTQERQNMILTPIRKEREFSREEFNLMEKKFRLNSERLLNALDIRAARTYGFCCPNCSSGTGPKGTGMQFFITDTTKRPKFKCFACDKCFSAADLVLQVHPEMTFHQAVRFLIDLYTPEDDPINDCEPKCYHRPMHLYQPLTSLRVDESLMATYTLSVQYRKECPEWQQAVADKLGIPFDALNREDIGKSFVRDDGTNPNAGDLVTFNLLNGRPYALKVRHTEGIGYKGELSFLDYSTNSFRLAPTRGEERTFRQAGNSGELCFGHDGVTDAITTVAIAEGQSDVLAICAAASECHFSTLTAIGRDSASHVLKSADLSVLRGKDIIYCQDADSAGQSHTSDNLGLLTQHCNSVHLWTPSAPNCKDARAVFTAYGAEELLRQLFTHSH